METPEKIMKLRSWGPCLVLGASFLLQGCAGSIAKTITAYGTTAEEQAILMRLNFDNCLSLADPALKEASCNAVRSSIDAYQQSATQLKKIGGTP